MRENERVIEMRMQKVQEEKRNMEDKLYKAAVCIQKVARGMIARVAYKRQVEEQRQQEKQKLSNMLNNLQT
jgi:hypothetical protein